LSNSFVLFQKSYRNVAELLTQLLTIIAGMNLRFPSPAMSATLRASSTLVGGRHHRCCPFVEVVMPLASRVRFVAAPCTSNSNAVDNPNSHPCTFCTARKILAPCSPNSIQLSISIAGQRSSSPCLNYLHSRSSLDDFLCGFFRVLLEVLIEQPSQLGDFFTKVRRPGP